MEETLVNILQIYEANCTRVSILSYEILISFSLFHFDYFNVEKLIEDKCSKCNPFVKEKENLNTLNNTQPFAKDKCC